MAHYRLANRYAKGFLSFAKETNKQDEVYAEMKDLLTSIQGSRELRTFLKSPVLDKKRKAGICKEVFSPFSAATQTFIQMVVSHGRENALVEMAKSYIGLYNVENSISKVKVTSAIALDDTSLKQIGEKAKVVLDNQDDFEITNVVDTNLLGGFVLRVGDKQIDTSLRSKLDGLRKEFDKNEYVPKF